MRPNVLIPIRDRRQRRRIVTLKNFGWLCALLVVVLISLSFDLFSWRPAEPGQYGRLVQKEIVHNDDVKARAQIVTEAPVTEQNGADPLLLASAAREQEFLTTTQQPPPAPIAPPIETRAIGSGNGVAVVGDPGGVVVVRSAEAAKRPVLAGGIFRQGAVPASARP